MSHVIKEATCQQALAALGDRDSVVIDVRCQEEYALYGQIAGAYLIPWKLIRDDALVDNQHFHRELKNAVSNCKGGMGGFKLYFICGSGNRSCDAAECALDMLGDDGYEVYNVVGGIDEWVCSGLPTSPAALSA
ncbi:MAG: rhodanese-like domain-containing protein [Acidithiobacillus ferrooxidans]